VDSTESVIDDEPLTAGLASEALDNPFPAGSNAVPDRNMVAAIWTPGNSGQSVCPCDYLWSVLRFFPNSERQLDGPRMNANL